MKNIYRQRVPPSARNRQLDLRSIAPRRGFDALQLPVSRRWSYSFLMLELMIALFLVGTFALPLARLPMQAMHEEYKSAYRMQAQRLADLRFADFKEKLYKQEIPWKEMIKTRQEKFKFPSEDVEVSFAPLGKRKFLIEKTLHSLGKKTKEGEEYRLATLRVKITAKEKGMKLFRTKKRRVQSRVYTYQTLVCKSALAAGQIDSPEAVVPPTEIPSS